MSDTQLSEKVKIAAAQFIEEREYWTAKLSGEPETGYFHYDFQIEESGSRESGELSFNCGSQLSALLSGLSKGSDPKLHMILTAGLAALLSRYTGSSDIIIGTTIDKQETDSADLINTVLPLRLQLTGGMTFKELLLLVRTTVNEAIANQNFPIESLTQTNGFSLFDVALVLENIQDREYLTPVGNNLTFSFRSAGGSVEAAVLYNSVLYREETVRGIGLRLLRLLETVLGNIDIKIADIDLMTEEEKSHLEAFNRTAADYPAGKTIHQLFEEQAERTPENIALKDQGVELTYRELNRKADRLASELIEKGAGPGEIVAVLSGLSAGSIVNILAVLKTGAAYLPIDPGYPKERIDYILNDSNAKIVLNPGADSHGKSPLERALEGPRRGTPKGGPESLAYIIYTSGSTGRPKGVMVEHRSLVNYVCWAAGQYVNGERAAFPFYTSMAFDLTVTSIFVPLITGNTVVVYSGEEGEFLIEKVLRANEVDVVKLTPTHLKMIRDEKDIIPSEVKIRRFILGGEELETGLCRDIHENFHGGIEICNEYGPTEATVGCMIYRFDPGKDRGRSVPIGVPAANTGIHLLDSTGNPVPPGFIGEIYISEIGVARGYLNCPELTADAFVAIDKEQASLFPTSSTPLYKTGDLGRWTWDGNIEFLGRVDEQVKVRGYRIELGEVESRLLSLDSVREAVVTARDDKGGYKQLCAYYVPYDVTGDRASPQEIREALLKQVPDYMVPLYFVCLESLPVTANGKVDRRSLPEPEESVETGVEYREPRSPVETVMVQVWQEILGIEQVGIDDGYFALGGDSVRAIQIAAALQQKQLKMEIADLFKYPTIAQLSPFVTPVTLQVSQEPVAGEVPLTPIQHWFFEKDPATVHPFNMSVMLHRADTFDTRILEKVFRQMLIHHDALRMRFTPRSGGGIVQFNRGLDSIDDSSVLLQVFDFKNRSDWKSAVEETARTVQESVVGVGDDYLLKPVLFRTFDGDYLLIAVHHLVMDAVSWRIVLEDFQLLYKGLERGEDVRLPLKTSSFKEWAGKLCAYADSPAFLPELDYWLEVEQSPNPPLPGDGKAVHNRRKDTRQQSVALSPEETGKLLKEVNKAYNTEINDILLAALGLAFKRWAGTGSVVVDLEGHGREEILEGVDVTRTVGWFTSLYPIVIRVPDMENNDPGALVKETKEMLRQIPTKGVGYGLLKYLTSPENRRNRQFSLQPRVNFNYLGQFDGDIDTGFFQMAGIPSGDPVSGEYEREYTLEFTGAISDGKFSMGIGYNPGEYESATIAELAAGYRESLLDIIRHCTAKEESELTVSDLTSSDFDQQEMEDILGEFGDD
ncbi:MAG: amino acid adenylation domain-containing protein [bacterium]|nr:amino acid adenylation domain-containing protein [bacterium]